MARPAAWFVNIIVLGAAAAALNGCDNEPNGGAEQPSVSYASHEPGSIAAPTNDLSFHLMADDGPTRLAAFQNVISQSGKKCDIVISAMLTGALDGTDEWKAKCADGGIWAVWFKADSQIEVKRCSAGQCT